jgi:hypothetical protein
VLVASAVVVVGSAPFPVGFAAAVVTDVLAVVAVPVDTVPMSMAVVIAMDTSNLVVVVVAVDAFGLHGKHHVRVCQHSGDTTGALFSTIKLMLSSSPLFTQRAP